MVTLAAQVGGPEVPPAFDETIFALRKRLEKLSTESYVSAPAEFALILRVNASLVNYGPEGIEPPILRRDYIQVDIVIGEQTWALPPDRLRECLAGKVGFAIKAIATRLERAKCLLVPKEELLSAYLDLVGDFPGAGNRALSLLTKDSTSPPSRLPAAPTSRPRHRPLNYVLVIQWPLSTLLEFDLMIDIENRLIASLTDCTVDGHDWGSGEGNIFIYTSRPRQTFAAVRKLLQHEAHWAHLRAGYRRDSENLYRPIHPRTLLKFQVI